MTKKMISIITCVVVIAGICGITFFCIKNNKVSKAECVKQIMMTAFSDADFETIEKKFEHKNGSYITFAERCGAISDGELTAKNCNQPITRLELAKILGRIEDTLHPVGSFLINDEIIYPYEMEYKLQFEDIDELDKEERRLLTRVCNAGYMDGFEDNTFRPNHSVTKKELSMVLDAYKQNL